MNGSKYNILTEKKRLLSVNVTIYEKKKKKLSAVKKEIIHAKLKHIKFCLLVETSLITLIIHSHSDHQTDRTFDEMVFNQFFFGFSLSCYALHFQPDHF